MKGHPTHRSTFLHTTAFSGQRQFQFLGCDLRILKKHLIKIAQAIK